MQALANLEDRHENRNTISLVFSTLAGLQLKFDPSLVCTLPHNDSMKEESSVGVEFPNMHTDTAVARSIRQRLSHPLRLLASRYSTHRTALCIRSVKLISDPPPWLVYPFCK